MWFLGDNEIALVLALVRRHVATSPNSRVLVDSHVQMRGKKRKLTWDGVLTAPWTYTHIEPHYRWLPGRKKILHSLALTCKQDILYDLDMAEFGWENFKERSH